MHIKEIEPRLRSKVPSLADQFFFVDDQKSLPHEVRILGDEKDIGGVCWKEKLWLLTANLYSRKEAITLFLKWFLRHETRCQAFSVIFDPQKRESFFLGVDDLLKEDVDRFLAEWTFDNTVENRILAAEEVVVQLAARGVKNDGVNWFLAVVAVWVRKLFPDVKFSIEEVRDIICYSLQISNKESHVF